MTHTLLSLVTSTLAVALLTSASAQAGPDAFTTGPLIEDFGPNAEINTTVDLPEGVIFRHSFDFAEAAEPGELNRHLVSLARFLNMHVRAGVAPENIQLATIVHGNAVFDVTRDEIYADEFDGAGNANAPLIRELQAHGVQIYVCGQSAAYYDVDTDQLLPGVEMALSAMTMHALLQQDGYTLNPF